MYMQRFMGWGYMRLCCHLVGSRSLIEIIPCEVLSNREAFMISRRLQLAGKKDRHNKLPMTME